jgi:hypothetical protein
MKKLLSTAVASLALVMFAPAHAGTITDTYVGSDDHGYGDVIGKSVYNISSATITRASSVLSVTVATNFAGNAGSDAWASSGVGAQGIGYGDLFLASTWNPAGTDAGHLTDNAKTGTDWAYGLSLDNRWSNTGGTFKLYNLQNGTNSTNIINSNSFLSTCSGCVYRTDQAVAVNTAAGTTAADTGITGTWAVNAVSGTVSFSFNMANTSMINFSSFAMHWGEICGNDVIEGATRVVPTPGTVPLLALGLGLMLVLRRRRTAKQARA